MRPFFTSLSGDRKKWSDAVENPVFRIRDQGQSGAHTCCRAACTRERAFSGPARKKSRPLDCSEDPASCRARETLGRLDYAFNNAGISGDNQLLTDQTEETFDRVFDVNVKALFLLLQDEVKQMMAQRRG
jgi:NAD(P)-dependent dehydrogenase (short-subunit alcohol dehydrogenase family)